MKAVVLAAGKGTRMGELTTEIPKPMLQVEGMPLLEHIVRGTLGAGVEAIHLIVGWKEEVIRGHFGDGSPWNTSITYSTQTVRDGTGRAPELAREFVGEDTFLLTYGDILVRKSTYRRMADRYAGGDLDAVLAVVRGEDVAKGGLCFFDRNRHLSRLVEKPGPEEMESLGREGWIREGEPLHYNAGVYLFGPSLFDHTAQLRKSPRGEYELTDAISMMVEAGERIAGMEIEGRWADVRDPGVLAGLQARPSD